ncbi:MAG: hypothetical protein RRC07_12390 [Anaerolineae bacterium]|nr:hypothetical protein [Anaerolineae bacterium]
MQEDTGRSVDDLKAEEQASYEIPIEEDVAQKAEPAPDVTVALRDLGRQFASTIQAAWNSQERREFEGDVREGIDQFAAEVRKAFREIKESGTAQRVREEADEAKERVERADLAQKARNGLVEGLDRLSQELGKLADQFSPAEKPPTDVDEEDVV